MKVCVAQLNLTIGDYPHNVDKIVKALHQARAASADVVLFSELTLCGYPPEDLMLHDAFVQAGEEALLKILPHTSGLMAVVGLVRRHLSQGEKPLLNSAAIIQDGRLVGFQDKALLPTYDVFDERRYFEPGTTFDTWEWRGKKIGVLICEDIWQHADCVGFTRYRCDPVQEMRRQRVDLLLNLSASPYHFQKPTTRVKVCQVAAQTLQAPVILCAQVGGNDQLVFDGYSVVVDREGKLRYLGEGFAEDIMMVDLEAEVCSVPFVYDAMHDLYRALVLGTRDYFYKQGLTDAILGLSGGIDSAVVACIAAEALGPDHVTAVALPSRYNPHTSLTDAELLARNLHVHWKVVPIQPLVDPFFQTLQQQVHEPLGDITQQNVQARVRGLVLMALANQHNAIVLCTSNKSEQALGYCTLYGDMIGGIAVISDVTKTQVYRLARWINRERMVIPRSILEKAPSAELKPGQRDIDTLPDFGAIDAVIQSYVEDLMDPQQIVEIHHLTPTLVKEIITMLYTMEYKRRQAPPGIRVSKKSFRVGRNYPIVHRWSNT